MGLGLQTRAMAGSPEARVPSRKPRASPGATSRSLRLPFTGRAPTPVGYILEATSAPNSLGVPYSPASATVEAARFVDIIVGERGPTATVTKPVP